MYPLRLPCGSPLEAKVHTPRQSTQTSGSNPETCRTAGSNPKEGGNQAMKAGLQGQHEDPNQLGL